MKWGLLHQGFIESFQEKSVRKALEHKRFLLGFLLWGKGPGIYILRAVVTSKVSPAVTASQEFLVFIYFS